VNSLPSTTGGAANRSKCSSTSSRQVGRTMTKTLENLQKLAEV
jgi:hypothetical protein